MTRRDLDAGVRQRLRDGQEHRGAHAAADADGVARLSMQVGRPAQRARHVLDRRRRPGG